MASATMLVPARLCLHDWSQTAASGKSARAVRTRLLAPAREPQQTRQKDWPLAARWHEGPADITLLLRPRLDVGFASGISHNTHCAFVPLVPRSTPLFFSCRHSPLAGALLHGIKGRTMCRCVQHRCFTVTLTLADGCPDPAPPPSRQRA